MDSAVTEAVSDLDGLPLEPSKPEANLAKFTKSKWETVDETELEAQGNVTSDVVKKYKEKACQLQNQFKISM